MSNSSQAIKKLHKAQSLLTEVEELLSSGERRSTEQQNRGEETNNANPTGIFDGRFLVTDDGKKYQVPPNYASKSMLVVGDRLELINEASDSEGSQNFVKPINKVERIEVEGILTKKEHQWAVVTDAGTYWVLPASVEYYDGEIGDRVKLVLPKDFTKRDAKWAAVEAIIEDDGARNDAEDDESAEQRGSGLSGEIVLDQAAQKNAEETQRGTVRKKEAPSPAEQDVEELR